MLRNGQKHFLPWYHLAPSQTGWQRSDVVSGDIRTSFGCTHGNIDIYNAYFRIYWGAIASNYGHEEGIRFGGEVLQACISETFFAICPK